MATGSEIHCFPHQPKSGVFFNYVVYTIKYLPQKNVGNDQK